MDAFRQDGDAKVYWLTVMTPRDADAARVDEVVNAAVKVAAQPWADQVRIIDTVPVFTPGGRYTDSIEVDGADTIVRESDGIHLNEAGSENRRGSGDRSARSGFRLAVVRRSPLGARRSSHGQRAAGGEQASGLRTTCSPRTSA